LSNHWIFKVNDDSEGKISLEGIKIYNHRMSDRAWGIKEYTKAGRKAANVSHLKTGDRVIFYLCGNDGHCFLGTAILKTGFPLVELVVHKEFLDWKWGVELTDFTPLARQVKIEELRGKVHFVPEGENYGSYIQGAITRIAEEDYNLINNRGS
jgi:hypothetical protein